jgi:hypothetical protein
MRSPDGKKKTQKAAIPKIEKRIRRVGPQSQQTAQEEKRRNWGPQCVWNGAIIWDERSNRGPRLIDSSDRMSSWNEMPIVGQRPSPDGCPNLSLRKRSRPARCRLKEGPYFLLTVAGGDCCRGINGRKT